MNKHIKIICEDSGIGRCRAQIAKAAISKLYPEAGVEINHDVLSWNERKSHSAETAIVLYVDDLTDLLNNSNAAAENFNPNSPSVAFIRKDAIQSIAIFNDDVTGKINRKESIRIGTSVPHLIDPASRFFSKAFPSAFRHSSIPGSDENRGQKQDHTRVASLANPAPIEVVEGGEEVSAPQAKAKRDQPDAPHLIFTELHKDPEQSLRKLESKVCDGVVIPLADLNLLLEISEDAITWQRKLLQYQWMILPVFDCPPPLGVGYTVLTTKAGDAAAAVMLEKLNSTGIQQFFQKESEFAANHPQLQNIGVFRLELPTTSFNFISGKNADQKLVQDWQLEKIPDLSGVKNIFSGTDYMKSFFSYSNSDEPVDIETTKGVFIASHKAIHSEALKEQLRQKPVWAAGSRTWYELARMGIWVNGCADALGLESAYDTMCGPLPALTKEQICILTNKSSTKHWTRDGWKAIGTYDLVPAMAVEIREKMKEADMIFWTSFQQFEICKEWVRSDVIHSCAAGKTAVLLKEQGSQPVVFPTIKAFEHWRLNHL